MIPVANPRAQYETSRTAIDEAIEDVLGSGHYILGPQVEHFEEAFARYCGVDHAIGVNSGTDAISIALRALEVGFGDKVVTVSHTAVATVAAIIATGATPILVDIDSIAYTMDPSRLEDAMDEQVRAVVPVHLYGNLADMTSIAEVATRWDVPVVEDCAQATGARFGESRAGAMGRAGAFSFYPTKNLGALGDGGMVVTNDPALAEEARRLRQYGWDTQRSSDRPGMNSRLDEVQAAVLLAKLPELDAANRRRAEIADRYSAAFADLAMVTPAPKASITHAFHLYVIATSGREELRETLRQQGIETAVHYPVPVHRQPGYADKVKVPDGDLPHTDRVVEQILTLPLYPELTDDEVDQIIGAVTVAFAKGIVT